MIPLPELYATATQQNIPIYSYPMARCGSMSLQLRDGS